MKKKLFCLLLILILPVCLLFAGCATPVETTQKKEKEEHLFIVVDSFYPPDGHTCSVLVHKETRIMYLMQNEGGITVMVDKYGNPLIYYGAL